MGFLSGLAERLAAKKIPAPAITLADMASMPDEAGLPYLDRADAGGEKLTDEQTAWRRDGVLVLRNFIPDALIEPYAARRGAETGPAGWLMGSPYVHVPEMRALALYPPLMEKLKLLIGEDMLLHLCLTAWISTEREWHQDEYLSPDFVKSWYAAVWIALDDITPESGPFEYVPGSHRWPLLNGEKVREFFTEEERALCDPASGGTGSWPKIAERFVTPALDYEIARGKEKIVPFLAKKGDVLVWHGRLVHRGSRAQKYGIERRSLIAHYSGITHRPDMVARAQDENGQAYALFDTPLVS